MWTFLGEKMGKEQLSWFNSVYSLMLSDVDTDSAAAEKRPLRWGMRVQQNVSCFQNICSWATNSALQLLGNPISTPHKLLISQYISPWQQRLSSHPVPIKDSHPKCFSGGQRREKCQGQFDFYKMQTGRMRPRKRVLLRFLLFIQGKSDHIL